MSVIVNKDSKIYVFCPANCATGGPELLHQFVYILRNNGFNAFMYYIPNNKLKPVHCSYEIYNVLYVNEIEDNSKNILVMPEMYSYIKMSENYVNIKKIIWWLSVDNFYITRDLSYLKTAFKINLYRFVDRVRIRLFHSYKFDLPKYVLNKNKNFRNDQDKLLLSPVMHLVQSYYAYETLIHMGVSKDKILFLSDYLNDVFLNNVINYNDRKDIVLFNPTKGRPTTENIIKHSKNINFIAIENMSREEVFSLLNEAKVYIDFGNHQGKDRLPREAALSGCCIITGERGAAKNKYDIEIPDKYKFDVDKVDMNDIIHCISDCIENYNKNILNFEKYRMKILSEKDFFVKTVSEIFTFQESN